MVNEWGNNGVGLQALSCGYLSPDLVVSVGGADERDGNGDDFTNEGRCQW